MIHRGDQDQVMANSEDVGTSVPIMGVNVAAMRYQEALQRIDQHLSTGIPLRVAFANANLLNLARTAPPLRELLNDFLVFNDGVAVDLACRAIHNRAFPENLNGTDFIPAFLSGTRHQLRVFLLGGIPGVAQVSQRNLARKYPRHKFVGTHTGFFSDSDAPEIIRSIRSTDADILLVGMGNPRQEWWLARHLEATGCTIGFAIGAFIDFSAGRTTRAPQIIRAMRAEWLFRLALEPRRLMRRYTVDTGQFLFAALHERYQQTAPRSTRYR
jgi:alpha-1,3-mannosyltransferase